MSRKMEIKHLVRHHPMKCEKCNWVGTYEEAAMRFDQEKQVGGGKNYYIGEWGEPICVVCGAASWSIKLMPTETNPNSICNCRDVQFTD
jgi:hypothetical protein